MNKKLIKKITPIVQQMYDGLKSQNFERSVGDISCLYRGHSGLKCAVGHIIPDELYDDDIEGDPADSERVIAITPFKDLVKLRQNEFVDRSDEETRTVVNLMLALQQIHDFTPEDEEELSMQQRFVEFCEREGIPLNA